MALKLHKGSVRLGSGHSLIIGHGPMLSTMKFSAEEAKKTIASFGLFNLATPDSHSYYKNVTAEDLMPKPEDYIKPIFRGLSEVIVRKNYDPIDFGHEKGVLKDSAPKLLGQTIFSNHESFVGNEKGVVSGVFWDNGYTEDGLTIPAGINFEAMVDGKVHTKLARELLSDPPMVHSNSVTVQFGWMQSHPKMSLEEFRGKVGTHDDKGQLIRRIVNEIFSYTETSFVAHGADPYAQMIKDGKIVNPKYAVTRDSFSEAKHHTTFFGFDWKDSLSEHTIPTEDNLTETGENPDKQKPRKKMKLELALLMAAMAGVAIPEEQRSLSEEAFEAAFDEEAFTASILDKKTELETLAEKAAKVPTLEGRVQTLTSEKTTLEQFKTENEPKLAQLKEVETYKSALLADVLKAEALVGGKATDENLKATFEASDINTLKVFKQTFETQLEGKFPMECAKCGSHEVARNSARAGDENEQGKGGSKSFDDVRESLSHKPSTKSWLEGK